MDVILRTVSAALAAAGSGGSGGPEAARPDVLAVVLLVLGVIVLGFILVWSIRGKIARRQAETPTPHERIEAIRATAGARDSVEGARAQLVDTARRLAAQLDVKAARLEQLIVQADDRIAALRRSGSGVTPDTPALGADLPHEMYETTAAADPDPEPDPGVPDEAPVEAPPPAPTRVPAGTAADPLTAQVYELADDGHDPVAIAQTLDEQIGKVELILALRESA